MRRSRWLAFPASAIAALVFAGCGGSDGADPPTAVSPSPPARALTVEAKVAVFSDLEAQAEKPWTTGVDCTSYDFEGERIQVLDGSGNILGVAEFPTAGTWEQLDPANTGPEYQWDGTCTWSATVDDLTESNVYVVELIGWEPQTYDADELEADNWVVSLDL